MEEINKFLDKIIVEKTFSLEAVGQIKKMGDEYVVMETKLKDVLEDRKNISDQNTVLSIENNKLKERDADVSKREIIVKDKENKQALNDLRLEHANIRANEIRELFGVVFKNPVVRSNVYKSNSVPVAQNGYVGTHNGNETENRTVEEE